jgi:hypothetical protein
MKNQMKWINVEEITKPKMAACARERDAETVVVHASSPVKSAIKIARAQNVRTRDQEKSIPTKMFWPVAQIKLARKCRTLIVKHLDDLLPTTTSTNPWSQSYLLTPKDIYCRNK